MPDLTITEVPADLLDSLRRSADIHCRTLNDEVLIRLTRSTGMMPDRHELLERIRCRRDRMSVVPAMHEEIDAAKRYGRA